MELPATIARLQENDRLRDCVKRCLGVYGMLRKRISRDTSHRYIERAFEKVRREHGHAMPSEETALCELLCPAIHTLVDSDEHILLQIIETTDWPALTKKLLALTIRRHGFRINQYGASADDYVQEAVALLLQRRRHYPVDRKDLTLFTFLVRTIDNLFDHANKKKFRDGEPARIVSNTDVQNPDEWAEERVPSAALGRDEELIAAETASRFLSWLGDDLALQTYARLRIEDFCSSAAAYASELHTTVEDVRNRERRFRRRVRQYGELRPK